MSNHTHTPSTNSESPAHMPSGFWTLFLSDVANIVMLMGIIFALACFAATLVVTVVR